MIADAMDSGPVLDIDPLSFFVDILTAILLCRLIVNLRHYNMAENGSSYAMSARPMSSVRFADALLDNIGASISIRDGDLDHLRERNAHQHRMNVTWEQVVNNPLAIGLEDDMRRISQMEPPNHGDVIEIGNEAGTEKIA